MRLEGCNLVNYDRAEARLAAMRIREEQAAQHAADDERGSQRKTLWNVSRELSVVSAEIAGYKRVPKRLIIERDRLQAMMFELLQSVEAAA